MVLGLRFRRSQLGHRKQCQGFRKHQNYAQNLYEQAGSSHSKLTQRITEIYPTLNLWLSRDSTFNGNINLTLYDTIDKAAQHEIITGSEKWFQTHIGVGNANDDLGRFTSGLIGRRFGGCVWTAGLHHARVVSGWLAYFLAVAAI
jgi:hypothetical protein